MTGSRFSEYRPSDSRLSTRLFPIEIPRSKWQHVTGRALDTAEIKARLNGLTRVIIGGTRSVRKYFECFAVRRVEIERFLREGAGINRSKNANWFQRAAEWKEKKTEREKSLSFIDRLFIDTFYSTDKSID